MRAFLLLSSGSDMMYRIFDSNEQCQSFSKARYNDQFLEKIIPSPLNNRQIRQVHCQLSRPVEISHEPVQQGDLCAY